MPDRINKKRLFLLLILAYFFLMFGNGIVALTDPDEVFYAQTAKEMIRHNSWATPYLFGHPQFEKPVFLYWLMRIASLIFKSPNFIARFPPALFGILGVLAIYGLGTAGFRNEKKGFLSALIMMSSGLYIGLSRTVFCDMVFSVFILFSLAAFFWGYLIRERKVLGLSLFYIFSSLAVFTKGPLGFIIPFLIVSVFLAFKKDLKYLFCKASLWGFIIFLLISLPWYILMFKKYGYTFYHEFFYNDHWRRLIEAEHKSNDKWYFYPLYMFSCMFPWSLYVVIALFYLFKRLRNPTASAIYLFLACWIAAVFLVFQFAHSKLVSYIFPLFPALALIAADFIYESIANKKRGIFIISILNFTLLLAIPINLFLFQSKYQIYLSSKTPMFILLVAIIIFVFTFLALTVKKKFLESFYLLAFLLPLFLSVVPFVIRDIQPYVSSKDACDYLVKNYKVDGTVLCSKFYVRGVRFYMDKETAVITPKGDKFFSPHPVLYLDSEAKWRDFFKQQAVTYCVLKKSYFQDIKQLDGAGFKVELLKVIADKYIARVSLI
jgi:4-amino-4-deoxy-L-arabinose transferase-like glycosyltransferase